MVHDNVFDAISMEPHGAIPVTKAETDSFRLHRRFVSKRPLGMSSDVNAGWSYSSLRTENDQLIAICKWEFVS